MRFTPANRDDEKTYGDLVTALAAATKRESAPGEETAAFLCWVAFTVLVTELDLWGRKIPDSEFIKLISDQARSRPEGA